ncbi:MAG: diheme cytochrome c [Gallionella sp.]|nr:diheme cytochrome c [Gallionella sp.]
MSVAQADDDDREGKYGESSSGKYGGENRGKSVQTAQTNAKFQQECSTCHIAYAPGLLPAESWRKVMAGLDKHFGSDASITAQENKEITDFLVNNASNRWSAPTSPSRITETAWFKRKHDSHEISPEVWKNPKVKSPANCAACHPQAERGDFNEHGIRMPR